MVIIDTGPIVSIFDKSEPLYEKCRYTLKTIKEPLLTTWPVLTESFYLLEDWQRGQAELWSFILAGGLAIEDIKSENYSHIRDFMEKYSDRRIDVADASLLVTAEIYKIKTIFTLDRKDFSIYKTKHCKQFEIIP
ncbi:MAG: PIN domain-containing protein [Nitrospirae bacterium]|nr:PIN domain-containing protein [Nitrospirota bacterium]